MQSFHPADTEPASREAARPQETDEEEQEVEQAMKTLRQAVTDLRKTGGGGSAASGTPHCLSVCYNQLQTLLQQRGLHTGGGAPADATAHHHHAAAERHTQGGGGRGGAGGLEEEALRRAAAAQVAVQ
mmetsp:Transcript_10548/g.21819  ORF Transcript_10548/g.21819 Transcript_10548/m.21819 type:complete len:128 (+) Transcript_10548:143-526(+)